MADRDGALPEMGERTAWVRFPFIGQRQERLAAQTLFSATLQTKGGNMSVSVSNWAWGLQCVQGTTKLVLMALADSADDSGACWPRVDTIAHKATASRATVKRALKKLEEIGLLRRKERLREDGSQASNVYHLAVGIDVPKPEITHDEQDELELETAEKVGAQNEPLGVQNEPGGVHRRTGEGFTGEPGRGSPVSPHIEPPIKPPLEPTLTHALPCLGDLMAMEPPERAAAMEAHGLTPASFGKSARQMGINPRSLGSNPRAKGQRKRDPEPSAPPVRRQVFVVQYSDQWKAWAATRARPWPTTDYRNPETLRYETGWWFPSEWPPGHERGEGS